MSFVLFGLSFWHVVFGVGMFSIALFLILLILVQRGRGGGLTGALGGMGGQSAFGTKAGDIFTKVTMVTAGIWILLCMISIKMLNKSLLATTDSTGPPTISAPGDDEEGDAEGATGEDDASGDDSGDGDSPGGIGATSGGDDTTSTDNDSESGDSDNPTDE